jgi:hypothetical protein
VLHDRHHIERWSGGGCRADHYSTHILAPRVRALANVLFRVGDLGYEEAFQSSHVPVGTALLAAA